MKRHTRLTIIIMLLLTLAGVNRLSAQPQQPRWGTVDIYAGVDFNYRDVFFNGRVFDLLINLTPSVTWNLPNRWQVNAQVLVPVLNQYGRAYRNVRPDILDVSWQLPVADRLRLKFSGGLFSDNRYGLDLKAMLILKPWVALIGEAGMTGYCSMADGWHASTIGRLTGRVGADFWLNRWTTEFKLYGGRFNLGDYGIVAEAWRHFKHVSVGLFGSYGNEAKENAGFKVIVMIPPYRRTLRRVNFRPADAFQIDYRNRSTPHAMRQYDTAPDQNERTGWFDRDMLPWGPDTMAPDFVYKQKNQKEGAE